jgi:hypothetical protein
MIKVVIGYGGAKAEEVANDLDTFLKKEGLEVFLVTPETSVVPSGSLSEVNALFRQNMLDCSIIVFVCHSETPNSKPAQAEIKFIRKNNLVGKTIFFSKCDDCIPKCAKNLWHPTHFTPEKAEESFCRLLNRIYQEYVRLSTTVRIGSEQLGGS